MDRLHLVLFGIGALTGMYGPPLGAWLLGWTERGRRPRTRLEYLRDMDLREVDLHAPRQHLRVVPPRQRGKHDITSQR